MLWSDDQLYFDLVLGYWQLMDESSGKRFGDG